MTIVFTQISCITSFAQVRCNVYKSLQPDSLNPFFKLSLSAESDTACWVQIKSDAKLLFLYKVNYKEEKTRVKYVANYSDEYKTPHEAILKLPSYQVDVILNKDSLLNFPLLCTQTFTNDTPTTTKVLKHVKQNITLPSISYSFIYNSEPFDAQQLPQISHRLNINGEFKLGSLPLSYQFNLNNDNPQFFKNNLIALSFDKEKYLQQLKQQVPDTLQAGGIDAKLNGLYQQELDIHKRKIRLEEQLAKDTLSRQYKRDLRLLEKSRIDTVSLDTNALKQAESRMKLLKGKQQQITEFNDSIQQLKAIIKKQESAKHLTDFKKNELPNYVNKNRIGGRVSALQSIVGQINQFDVGSFTPMYHRLITHGSMLSGVNLSFNIKKIMVGGFAGISYISQRNFFNNTLLNQGFAHGHVIGYQPDKRNSFSVVLVRSTTNDINSTSDNSRLTNKNMSLGLGYKFQLKKVVFEAGIANSALATAQSLRTQISDQIKATPESKNNAYFADIQFRPGKVLTLIRADFRWIDPNYFSPLAFHIRRDNLRLNLAAQSKFKKNKLQINLRSRQERDNLYGFKYSTVLINHNDIGIRVQLNKKSSLTSLIGRTIMNILNKEDARSTSNFSTVQFIYNTSVINTNLQQQVFVTIGYGGGFSSDTATFVGENYNASVLYLLDLLNIKTKIDLNVNLITFTGTNQNNNIQQYQLSVTKTILSKFSIIGGYGYQHDMILGDRGIYQAGTRINTAHKFSIQLDCRRFDMIKNRSKDAPLPDNTMISLTLNKSF